jgi:lipoprotein-releasing system ATP-binding protein
MLTAKNIRKSYGSLDILRGIDLEVSKGEMVSIVGKSGAGKSTLLQILGTLDKADSGSLQILDQDISALSEKQLADFRNKYIGFVFQFHHLLPEFNAVENVCIPAYIHGASKKDTIPRAKEILKYLGLARRLTHKPTQLSGGEAQRLAVARALINNPSLVLADEPTGNLDKSTSDSLHELFLNLRKDFSCSFVIVTHNLDLAQLSDRVVTIEDGIIKSS